MAIDIRTEEVITLRQAANEVVRGGVAPSTTWRWSQKGVRGIRLESVVIGGKRYTSTEALARFAAALTAADERSRDGNDADQYPPARDESTLRRLEKAGLIKDADEHPPSRDKSMQHRLTKARLMKP